MKKNMLTIILAAIALAFQACHKISGQGSVITKNTGISGFTSINMAIDGDIYITPDTVFNVEIHAQANILDNIQTIVQNGELNVQYTKFRYIGNHDHITINISAPYMAALRVSGSGSLHALSAMHADNMELKVDGSGNIDVAAYNGTHLSANISGSGSITANGGETNIEDIRINGSGSVNLSGVRAQEVTTDISGSGDITVTASGTLNVHTSGSGNVYYYGYPAVYSTISGSGKLIHL
jgi:hypothetical protein